MLQNLKTRVKLSLLSFIALVGIIILGSLGIIQLKEVNNGLERVYHDRVVPLEQLKIIADEYAVNIVDTTHQTRNGNFGFDKCISNINSAQEKIKDNWDKYLSTTLTREEKVLSNEANQLMKVGDVIVDKIKQTCINKDLETITKITINELYPKIDPIGEKISALISLQLDEAKKETQIAENIYNTSKIVIIVTILASFLIILVLSYLIISDITGKINILKTELLNFFSFLNREKSEASLLDINSKDEFGEMAIVINENIVKTRDLINQDNLLLLHHQII